MVEKRSVALYSGTLQEITSGDVVYGTKIYHGTESITSPAWDDDTKVFSATQIIYWYKGTRVTVGNASFNLTTAIGTYGSNKLYYIYFGDYSGTLSYDVNFWDLTARVPIATVYWNGSIGAVSREWHNHTRNIDWHIHHHLTEGSEYYNGFSLNKPTISIDNALEITGGTIYDEDLPTTLVNNSTTARVFYQVSAGVYTFVNTALPYAGSGVQPQYLDTDTYNLTNVGASEFACYWIYGATEIDSGRHIYIVPTHAATAYNTIAQARLETRPALAGLGLSPEIFLLYRFIYKGNGDFQESADYRLTAATPGGGSASTTASAVTFIPYGNIASTNVQTALQELDDEKLSSITDHVHSAVAGQGGLLNGTFIKASTADGTTDAIRAVDSGNAEIFAVDSDGNTDIAGGVVVSGKIAQLNYGISRGQAANISASTYTVADNVTHVYGNYASGTLTITMPNPTTFPYRELCFTNFQAQSVVSASSNIYHPVGGATSTILANTIGKWVHLKSDGGSYWVVTSFGG